MFNQKVQKKRQQLKNRIQKLRFWKKKTMSYWYAYNGRQYLLIFSLYIEMIIPSQDKYKRALADGENMRQRLTKQIQDAKIFGIQSFCKDLLEVADTLSQATKAVPKEEINNNNPHLKNLFDGVCGIKNSLDQVFRRHGLEIIDPLNSKFDPNFHEALFQKVGWYNKPNKKLL